MEFYSAMKRKKKKKRVSLVRWMNLGRVIKSEVSQKEKNKYSILMHTHEILKNGTGEYLKGRNIYTDVEEGLVNSAGEGECGTI